MEHGFPIEDRDLVREPLSTREIQELADNVGGTMALISKRSPKYRDVAERVKTQAEWNEAMAQEPRLIRRPIWHSPEGWVIGFKAEDWEHLLRR